MVAKGDSNPGSLDCESGVLPLSYAPQHTLYVVVSDVSSTKRNSVSTAGLVRAASVTAAPSGVVR